MELKVIFISLYMYNFLNFLYWKVLSQSEKNHTVDIFPTFLHTQNPQILTV